MEFVKKITYHLFEGKFAAYGQFIKFAIAGGICAVIETLLLIFLKNIYNTEDVWLLSIFNTTSYGVGAVINYIISRIWVFEGGKYRKRVEFAAFFAVATVGLAVNQLVFYIFVNQLSADWYIVAKVVAIASVVMWNFLAKKHLVFKG